MLLMLEAVASDISEDETRLNELSYKKNNNKPFWHPISFKIVQHSENDFIQSMKNWLPSIKLFVGLWEAYNIHRRLVVLPQLSTVLRNSAERKFKVYDLWRRFLSHMLYLYLFSFQSESNNTFISFYKFTMLYRAIIGLSYSLFLFKR